MEFNIGDLVTGLPESNGFYDITNSKSICRVVNISANKQRMSVEVISNPGRTQYIGEIYPVECEHFTLVDQTLLNRSRMTKLQRHIDRVEKRHLKGFTRSEEHTSELQSH